MLIPVGINQFVSVWWLYNVEKNNIPFFYLYMLIELLFLSRIFYSYLTAQFYKWLIPLIAGIFISTMVLYLLTDLDRLWAYSTYYRAIEAVIILFYAGSHFIEIYQKQDIMELHKTSKFWIGSGLILYFSCNLLLYIFSNLVLAQKIPIQQSIWVVHAILTILLYLSFTKALLCKKTEIKF